MQEVADRVAASEQEAEDAGENLKTEREKAQGYRNELEELRRGSARRRADTLLKASADVIQKISSADSQRISEVLGVLGHDVESDQIERMQDVLALEAERAFAGFGRASTTWRGVFNAVSGRGGDISRQVYATLILGVVAIGVLISLQAAWPEVFGAGIAAVLGLVSSASAVGVALLRVHRFVEPVFRTANEFAVKLEAAERQAANDEKYAREKLSKTEDRIAEIERRQQTFSADAARFRGGAPEQVLDYFIQESETTRSFDSALGVVSRVRRALETLDAIFREAHEQKRRRPASARFERIVLYV